MNPYFTLKVKKPLRPQVTRNRTRMLPIGRASEIILVVLAWTMVIATTVYAHWDSVAIGLCSIPENPASIARCLQALIIP